MLRPLFIVRIYSIGIGYRHFKVETFFILTFLLLWFLFLYVTKMSFYTDFYCLFPFFISFPLKASGQFLEVWKELQQELRVESAGKQVVTELIYFIIYNKYIIYHSYMYVYITLPYNFNGHPIYKNPEFFSLQMITKV